MLWFSKVLWLRCLLKTGVAEDRLLNMSPKFAPCLRERAIWKSKSLNQKTVSAIKLFDSKETTAMSSLSDNINSSFCWVLDNGKNWQVRTTVWSWSRQNLHHACARERFGSQNRKKLAWSENFLKLKSPKFAPRLHARAIWTSKSWKNGMIGALLEVQVSTICTTPARESDSEAKTV